MGPTWVLSAPDGPHVGPMNLAIRENLFPVMPILETTKYVFADYQIAESAV